MSVYDIIVNISSAVNSHENMDVVHLKKKNQKQIGTSVISKLTYNIFKRFKE